MRIYKIILAGILCTGFFIISCNNPTSNPVDEAGKGFRKKERIDSVFDCKTDSLVPLGFIDTDWVYKNQPLGIQFKFPKGWNATEDITGNSPAIVPVGESLSEFRETSLRPHGLKLALMKGQAWDESRFLFGITQLPPISSSDTSSPDFSGHPLVMAAIFYGKEFANEKELYKEVLDLTMESWEEDKMKDLIELNKATFREVKSIHIGTTDFYFHTIRAKVKNKSVYSSTLLKKMDCLFLVISLHWHDEKEKAEGMKTLQGLRIVSAGK